MTLPAPADVPPMVLLAAVTNTPWLLFPKLSVPVRSVPMKLPCTVFPVVAKDTPGSPAPVWPAMTLPAPGVVPPTVLLMALARISTPVSPLGKAAVPAALVPMKFPWMMFPVEPATEISTPSEPLPEIRLRAAGVVPPMRLLAEPLVMNTPWLLAPPRASVPVGSVPRKFPSTTLPSPVASVMPPLAPPLKSLITSPRTVLEPASMRKPDAASPLPSISISSVPLKPVALEFNIAPGCV